MKTLSVNIYNTTSNGSLLPNTSSGLFAYLLLRNMSTILHNSHIASSKMTSLPTAMISLPVETSAESSLPVSGTQALWPSDNDDNLHDGSGSPLTYGLDDDYSLHIEASKQLWDLVRQDETVVLVVFLSIVTCVGIIAVVASKIILRRRHQYQLIPNSMDPTHRFNYIYRPLHGNAALDNEYENTFVGVSIPILQENTRI